MAESPFINWYTSDFLTGVADLTVEQIGVYAVVLTMIADKGAPIDDEPRTIARRCGTTTRACNRVLEQLAEAGKIRRKNGVIGNKRMLQEVGKRDKKSTQAKAAADEKWRRWRDENKPQLPFGENPETASSEPTEPQNSAKPSDADAQMAENPDPDPRTGKKQPVFSQFNSQFKSEKNPAEPQNSADPDMRTHPDSRAGVFPEPESMNQTIDQEPSLDARAQDQSDRSFGDDPDFMECFEAVCQAAGYVPTGLSAQIKAMDHVKAWRSAQIDFALVVLPTIRAVIADSSDPTSSLARFDKRIRHEHARATGNPVDYRPPKPPDPPQLQFDGEPACAQAIRAELLSALGPMTYASLCHSLRLEEGPGPTGDQKILRAREHFPKFWDAERPRLLSIIAKRHGFVDAWQGNPLPKTPP